MKKFKKFLLGASLVAFLATGVTAGLASQNKSLNREVPVEAAVGNYYDSISDSLTGTQLLDALHTLNSTKRKKTIGYDKFRQFAAKCDIDPDGSGKIVGFYDNKLVGPSWDSGSTWNREHVWPNVRDGDKVEDDAHMVRPASTSTNSDRGSRGFGTQSYDPGKYVAYYRGAAARIIFYAAIADTSLQVVDYPFNYNGVNNGNNGYPVGSMGSLSDMLLWNLQYQPSDTSFTGANDLARRTELNRNEVIQNHSDGQGNRNPFIDHPEYACKIWGNTNDKTRQICGLAPASEPTSITLNKTSDTIKKGQTVQLSVSSVTPSDASKEVTWRSDNTSIASVSSGGLVSGVGVGTTTIYATSKVKTSVYATCTITVTEDTPEAPAPTKITLNYSDETIEKGQTIQLSVASVTPSDASKEVTWRSDDSDIASVDNNGLVTAVGKGVTVIYATSKVKASVSTYCYIEVIENDSGGDDSSSSESEPSSSESEPVTPVEPEKPKKKGCGGSLIAASIVVPTLLGLGALILIKKKKD